MPPYAKAGEEKAAFYIWDNSLLLVLAIGEEA